MPTGEGWDPADLAEFKGVFGKWRLVQRTFPISKFLATVIYFSL